MKKKLIFFLSLLMVNATFGQVHFIEIPSNQFRVKENNFYSYNYELHSFPYSEKIILDTLNYCRVRENKIKAVRIYEFYSATDSMHITTCVYDSSGFTGYVKRKSNPDEHCISCDSTTLKTNVPDKVIRKREHHLKEKWTTDNHGYVKEYKRINKGLLNHIYMNYIGPGDKKVTYSYDSLYLSVTETVSFSTCIFFRKYKEIDTRYVYTIDNRGNLLSEFYYKKNENGELVVTKGYTYHYEYY